MDVHPTKNGTNTYWSIPIWSPTRLQTARRHASSGVKVDARSDALHSLHLRTTRWGFPWHVGRQVPPPDLNISRYFKFQVLKYAEICWVKLFYQVWNMCEISFSPGGAAGAHQNITRGDSPSSGRFFQFLPCGEPKNPAKSLESNFQADKICGSCGTQFRSTWTSSSKPFRWPCAKRRNGQLHWQLLV